MLFAPPLPAYSFLLQFALSLNTGVNLMNFDARTGNVSMPAAVSTFPSNSAYSPWVAILRAMRVDYARRVMLPPCE